ncbi:MAG: hypothetical protein WKF78_13940 [Candidatus Limnocylindrales bacterium]
MAKSKGTSPKSKAEPIRASKSKADQPKSKADPPKSKADPAKAHRSKASKAKAAGKPHRTRANHARSDGQGSKKGKGGIILVFPLTLAALSSSRPRRLRGPGRKR